MKSPVQCARVVCNVQDDWMRVVNQAIFFERSESSSMSNNNSNKLEAVDGDKGIVLVVLHVQKSPLENVIFELVVPHEAKFYAIATACLE